MKIDSIELFPIVMPIHSVLTLPRGASRTRAEGKQVVLVKVTADDGTVGWGEAGPSRRWSPETTHSVYTTLKHYLAPVLIGHDPFDIHGAHEIMNREIATTIDPGQPVAKAAIDIALHDLVCRKLGITLQAWLGSTAQNGVDLSYLVSAADPESAGAMVESALAEGYRAFKVKVGRDPSADAEIMRAVVTAARDCTVWPDANQGFTLGQALTFCRAMEDLGIEVFEQPIPMTDVYGMRKLLQRTSMSIVLDEAAMGIPYVVELIRREAVEGLAIKINKVGGIHYARQMCDLARNAGMLLIGSGLMDARIGFAASVHVFAAYGIDYPVDLNGPQHISEDYLAKPYPMEGARALVPPGPGLGIQMDEAKIEEFSLRLP